MPPIDRYRGHEIDQVLYDSLMLDTTDSIMKVLVYVKPGEVVYPVALVDVDDVGKVRTSMLEPSGQVVAAFNLSKR